MSEHEAKLAAYIKDTGKGYEPHVQPHEATVALLALTAEADRLREALREIAAGRPLPDLIARRALGDTPDE
jgi:hypothetical protein